jgi:AbrB family looped-hinge helix DNA binding protein
MACSSTISSKGQITVPREIRNRLGLNEGESVEFIVKRNPGSRPYATRKLGKDENGNRYRPAFHPLVQGTAK